jgi:hypothetical protein
VRTLLETIQALDPTLVRHLSDVHLIADGRRATAYLCLAPPSGDSSVLVRQILPVGLTEQLQALAASGLVGQLNVSVLRWADAREIHLLAKTHAGSVAERTAWRQSLA